ncbi:MAG: hypothetical protein R2932_59680 [Caldilineaceae bacterium]
MQHLSHDYHQKQIARLLAAFASLPFPVRPTTVARHIAKGQPIRHECEEGNRQYLVTDGEVVILRNGRPLDLVECDEVLDMRLWPNATAMALSDCTLVAMVKSDSQGGTNENSLRSNLHPASI